MEKVFQILLIPILSLLLSSCSDDQISKPKGNLAPDTGLFLYPDSTINQQPSRLHVHWWGDDPDGVILGYYIKWEGIDSNWNFTTSNDSIFSLPIGSADTTYNFLISSVDAEGNGVYDDNIFQNGIDYGAEPFVDLYGNSSRDGNETFYDIGLIDHTPAKLNFPIKHTALLIEWSELTILPDTSFPVMTFAWDASDLDGDASILVINISLNDTNNFVSLNGSVRLITLRIKDPQGTGTEMEILINGAITCRRIFRDACATTQNDEERLEPEETATPPHDHTPIPDTVPAGRARCLPAPPWALECRDCRTSAAGSRVRVGLQAAFDPGRRFWTDGIADAIFEPWRPARLDKCLLLRCDPAGALRGDR